METLLPQRSGHQVKTAIQAQKTDQEDALDALDDFPEGNGQCVLLAAGALKVAIYNI